MSVSLSDVKSILRNRRGELVEAAGRAERAEGLARWVQDLKADLQKLERRRDAFQAVGDQPVEVPWQHTLAVLGTLEMQPLLSKRTGAELASDVGLSIDHLTTQIATAEREIEDLLK
jgi:hypothetical protein